MCIAFFLLAFFLFWGTRFEARRSFKIDRQHAQGDDAPAPEKVEKAEDTTLSEVAQLKTRLRRRYGFFWWYKVRLLMVAGEPEQITALAPKLATQGWLEGQRTVLIHAGSLHREVDETRLAEWRKLRRSRPLDGIVWAMTELQSKSAQWLDDGLRTLEKTGEALRYQPAVYLWQVCDSAWPQTCQKDQALTDSLVKSAKASINSDAQPANETAAAVTSGEDDILQLESEALTQADSDGVETALR